MYVLSPVGEVAVTGVVGLLEPVVLDRLEEKDSCEESGTCRFVGAAAVGVAFAESSDAERVDVVSTEADGVRGCFEPILEPHPARWVRPSASSTSSGASPSRSAAGPDKSRCCEWPPPPATELPIDNGAVRSASIASSSPSSS